MWGTYTIHKVDIPFILLVISIFVYTSNSSPLYICIYDAYNLKNCVISKIINVILHHLYALMFKELTFYKKLKPDQKVFWAVSTRYPSDIIIVTNLSQLDFSCFHQLLCFLTYRYWMLHYRLKIQYIWCLERCSCTKIILLGSYGYSHLLSSLLTISFIIIKRAYIVNNIMEKHSNYLQAEVTDNWNLLHTWPCILRQFKLKRKTKISNNGIITGKKYRIKGFISH